MIVVDDGSTDHTTWVSQGLGAQIVSVCHRKMSATRNSGAQVATGDYFFFVDADTLVDQRVVHAALKALRGGAVGGHAAFKFDGVVPVCPPVVASVRFCISVHKDCHRLFFRFCRIGQ